MPEQNTSKQSVTRLYAFAELLEIGTAAAIAFCFIDPDYIPKAGVVAAVLIVAAFLVRQHADQRNADLDAKAMDALHIVDEWRISTLAKVGVDEDILRAVSQLKEHGPLRGSALVSHLRDRLGKARAEEKLDLILRYTHVADYEPGDGGAGTTRRPLAPSTKPS